MSLQTEITRLKNAKASLKTSLEAKGVTVPADTKLDVYPALVDSIQTGGEPENLSEILSGSIVVTDTYTTQANEYGTTVIL